MPVRTEEHYTMEPSSTMGVALDLILKTLIASQDFANLQTKNWDAIARLIPGSTPGQVLRNKFLTQHILKIERFLTKKSLHKKIMFTIQKSSYDY